jgi:hypothetical protein
VLNSRGPNPRPVPILSARVRLMPVSNATLSILTILNGDDKQSTSIVWAILSGTNLIVQ